MIPQIIMIVLMSFSLSISAIKHGQPNISTHNVWATIIGLFLQSVILYFGGFWNFN